jgi:basic membrane lipoprotein Med (substrate-binding protein (PBP1-ABC) superfamily)
MTPKFSTLLRAVTILLLLFMTTFAAQPARAAGEKVGLVTTESGSGDLSFNYMAYQGLLQAEALLGVVGTVYEPATNADYETELQQCVADGNVLCFAVGFGMADAITNVATANPGVLFAILDYPLDTYPANLRGITFNEKQAGYLAGALAGKMTGTNVIGVVAGMEIPPVVAFVEGYRNGAQCVGTNVNVLKNYTGTFTDPVLGATVSADMINLGADVIFGAAGETGNGAILYSAQNGVWSIGVDSDQYVTLFGNGTVPGADKILTSAMKRLDTAVYRTIQEYLAGLFTAGNVTYSLGDDGVGLAPYHDADPSISQDIKDYITHVKDSVINGFTNIDYPCEPRFHAEIVENRILAMDWLPGINVTVTVDDPANGVGVDFTDTQITNSTGFINFDNLGGLVLGPGMYIEMTDGILTKFHTVTDLVVTEVDAATDTVWGTATPGGNLNVQYCDNTGCSWRRFVTIGLDNTWLADFSVPGGGASPEEQNILDILPGMRGEALEPADGGITDYQWYLPNTRIGARPTEDRVEGWEWPLGATVTLEINDPATPANPDFTDSTTVIYPPWDPNNTWFEIPFSGTYNLKPGDEVSVTDGTTTKTHTVTNLILTTLNPNLDQIIGTADPGSSVDVWVCDQNGCVARNETADGNGDWTADFSLPGDQDWELPTYDLQPGSSGDSGQFDPENDGTMIIWTIPNPTFGARVKEDRVEGWQWPLGATVTVEINDPATPPNPDFTDTATVTSAPWDVNQTWFNLDFYGQFDLKPGFGVSVSDNVTTKFQPTTGYEVTGFDINADIVSGTADPGAIIDLWVCDGSGCVNRTETADPSGIWAADFSVPGDEGHEQTTYDIQSGTTGDSAQWSWSGDGTMIQWGMTPYDFGKKLPANGANGFGTSVTISWDIAGHANTYQYCYDKTNDGQCANWQDHGALTTKALTGLTPNTTYYWQVRAVDAAGFTYANNGDWWSFKTKSNPITKTYNSIGTQDGWVLESAEISNIGGTLNVNATTFSLGDNAQKKQYRGILSFNTSGLPDNAVITKVTLKVKKQGILGGGNPVALFQGFMVDIKKGVFGTAALQTTDFQTLANKTYGPFTPALSGGWYSLNLNTAKNYINKLAVSGGLTQVRLRFMLDDNNNAIANILNLYSGNAPLVSRPQLIIEYYIP